MSSAWSKKCGGLLMAHHLEERREHGPHPDSNPAEGQVGTFAVPNPQLRPVNKT